MSNACPGSVHGQWAEFRFGVIGGLFSAPPERGQLGRELSLLAQRMWVHPITGESTTFDISTISRWYYTARSHPNDPVGALRPRVRRDRGRHRRYFAEAVWAALAAQYAEHPGWMYQLHADNLSVLCKEKPELGPLPSYPTVRRHLKSQPESRICCGLLTDCPHDESLLTAGSTSGWVVPVSRCRAC